MRFVVNNETFSVINEANSSINVANVLGVKESDGQRRYYLDRVFDILPDRVPEGWELVGVVSTIAIEFLEEEPRE